MNVSPFHAKHPHDVTTIFPASLILIFWLPLFIALVSSKLCADLYVAGSHFISNDQLEQKSLVIRKTILPWTFAQAYTSRYPCIHHLIPIIFPSDLYKINSFPPSAVLTRKLGIIEFQGLQPIESNLQWWIGFRIK